MEMLLGGVASFFVFHLISHPKALIGKKIPQAKIKRIQFLPNLRIEVKNKILHVHHWLWISLLFLAIQTIDKGMLKSDLLQGILLGGILQGLLGQDSLKLIHPATKPYIRKGYTDYPLALIRKIL